MGDRDPARREEEERPTRVPAPEGRAVHGAGGAAAALRAPSVAGVLALQRAAGNAAVSGYVGGGARIARRPRPPSGLRQDRSQVRIEPRGRALAPLDYLDFTSQAMVMHATVGGTFQTEGEAREFDYHSDPWNLSATWSYYDGADREVKRISDMPRAIAIWPGNIRDHVRRHGRSAFGTWTVRLEKDDYYDEVTFEVNEGASPGTLEGHTTQSFYNVRALPGSASQSLGELAGSEVPVRVDNKARADGRTWYRITLQAASGSMASGTTGWVIAEAVVPITGWDEFRIQLRAWEMAHAFLSLDRRITKLRQMCHDSDLPFDDVIGTGRGSEYANTRTFDRSRWEILRDSQQVRMPDGRVVDVYHLLVGLDVLPRRDESREIDLMGGVISRNIGENYSAATWAGDIGAAAADAAYGADSAWEGRNRGASEADKVQRYYSTRVPDADLYGNIDAWGIDAARSQSGAPSTIEGLLADYYGAPATAAVVGGPVHTSRRKSAVERFLAHYGFGVGIPYANLKQQPARARMLEQIKRFGNVWLERHDYELFGQPAARLRALDRYSELMTDRFLDWLQALADEVGAGT